MTDIRKDFLEGHITFLEEVIAKNRTAWLAQPNGAAFLKKWQTNLRRAKAKLQEEYPK